MARTFEAVIDDQGNVRILEPLALSGEHRALVTVFDEEPAAVLSEQALLSEPALRDWDRPEEDEAWAHLQPGS